MNGTYTKKQGFEIPEHVLWAPRKVRVACIGAGASGVMFCYKKEREFGEDMDLVVYERYPDVGGVWYKNRYPGCRCDIPSIAYQYAFAPNPNWPRYFSSRPDIHQYFKDFASTRGYIGKYIKLEHKVTKAIWIEEKARWRLTIERFNGESKIDEFQDEVDFLLGMYGLFSINKWPNIPGRTSFQGTVEHSADYHDGIDLHGKRVGVIGSGASAIQLIPEVSYQAKEVFCFYRTPQWISFGVPSEGLTDQIGSNFTFTEEQKQKFREDPDYYRNVRKTMETTIARCFPANLTDSENHKMVQEIVRKHMIEQIGHDEELIEKLLPDYEYGCRRMGPADGFIAATKQPHVHIIRDDLKEFTNHGVRTENGNEYELDVILCATGFDVNFRPPLSVVGRNGQELSDHFTPDPEAYLSLAVEGFPNLLLASLGPNNPAGHGNFLVCLEAAQDYCIQVIRKFQTEYIKTIEVKSEVVAQFNEYAQKWFPRSVWASGCRSWYNRGDPKGRVVGQYSGSFHHWLMMMTEPRFEDYDITYFSDNRFAFMGNGFTKEEAEGDEIVKYLEDSWINRRVLKH